MDAIVYSINTENVVRTAYEIRSYVVFPSFRNVRTLNLRLDGREFDTRPPRLTLGGERLRAGKPPQYFTEAPRPTQPPTLSGTGNYYRPKCDDALRLGVKAGWLIPQCG